MAPGARTSKAGDAPNRRQKIARASSTSTTIATATAIT
jgi:hypothetical protein